MSDFQWQRWRLAWAWKHDAWKRRGWTMGETHYSRWVRLFWRVYWRSARRPHHGRYWEATWENKP